MESNKQYFKESRLFPSTSVRQQFKQSQIFFERASRCLDLSKIPPRLKQDVAVESTLLLKEILDRIEVPTYAQIPGAEAVTDRETEIHIVKVESGPRAGEFLFSPETVANSIRKFKGSPISPMLPRECTNSISLPLALLFLSKFSSGF